MGKKKVKVYCRECDYYYNGEFYGYCESPKNKPLVDGWYRPHRVHKEDPHDKNRDNDCKDFKKKRSLWDKIRGVK